MHGGSPWALCEQRPRTVAMQEAGPPSQVGGLVFQGDSTQAFQPLSLPF